MLVQDYTSPPTARCFIPSRHWMWRATHTYPGARGVRSGTLTVSHCVVRCGQEHLCVGCICLLLPWTALARIGHWTFPCETWRCIVSGLRRVSVELCRRTSGWMTITIVAGHVCHSKAIWYNLMNEGVNEVSKLCKSCTYLPPTIDREVLGKDGGCA